MLPVFLLNAWSYVLQATPLPAEAAPEEAPGGMFQELMKVAPLFVMIYLVFYLLMIRPQRKQQQQHDKLLNALEKNDEVRTTGGLYGKVVSVDREHGIVTLKVDEQHNVRLRVARAAIVEVVGKKVEPSPERGKNVEKAGAS